jgi:hypothetical protein
VFSFCLPISSRRFLGITCFVPSSDIMFWSRNWYPFYGIQLGPFGWFQDFFWTLLSASWSWAESHLF